MATKLKIDGLSERHPGLSPGTALSSYEAASVCLHRHHKSPCEIGVEDGETKIKVEVAWPAVDQTLQKAWANDNDATEAGAYGMAIAAVEVSRSLYAVSRAETLSPAAVPEPIPGR